MIKKKMLTNQAAGVECNQGGGETARNLHHHDGDDQDHDGDDHGDDQHADDNYQDDDHDDEHDDGDV